MAALLEYKCPCCDAGISFDSTSQNMKCPYCGTEFDAETLASYDNELSNDAESNMQWETNPGGEWAQGETDGLNIYTCNSCGGEIVGDDTMASTKCPYCGNPVVVMGQFKGDLKPDYVIPFKLDKEYAKKALLAHYKGKKFLPKIFCEQNQIEEIKGVYVPFWLFDADADANIRYKATRVAQWSDSNYDYTETSYYSVTRKGSLGFEHVPVDGSTKMDDALMESIEPFNYSDAIDFKTAYLAGYVADKYDVTAEESIERANERIKRSTEQTFAETVHGYTTVTPVSTSINLSNGQAHYALMPVWILNTSWLGKKYSFAMNGQTGRFVGDLPIDKKKYWSWFAGITAVVAALSFGISILMYML